MEEFLIYSIKVSFSLAVFYLLYKAFFSRDTFFVLRRLYIQLALIVSLIIPFLKAVFPTQIQENLTAKAVAAPIVIFTDALELTNYDSLSYSFTDVLIFIPIIGSLFFLLRLIIHMRTVVVLFRNNKVERRQGCFLVNVDNNKFSSFSFFNFIFMNSSKDENVRERIFCHESIHARQFHSVDVMFMEIFLILFWWNPFVWLLRKEMKINHEYLADQGVLDQGCYKKDYQYTLLNSVSENTSITIINFFNVSQLSKRIAMMNKKRTSLFTTAKYLLVIPILGLLLVCNNLNANKSLLTQVAADSASINESIPKSIEADFYETLSKSLIYPVESQKNKVTGVVTVSFVIDKEGNVKDATIVGALDKRLDEEVLRVMNTLPRFENFSESQDSKYEVKILFILQDPDLKNKHKDEKADMIVVGYL